MSRRFPVFPACQRGATLAVVLILLVILTLLALTSMRGALLEQYMTTSQLDRSLSFQAAAAALREGEALAALKPTAPSSGCSAGVCATPDPTATPRWLDTDANWTADCKAATTTLGSNTATPCYIVEVMAVNAVAGANCVTSGDVSPDAACTSNESRYRITARSNAAGRAEVILQSNLAVP